MSASAEARRIADLQLEAYNSYDLEAYCALFHADAVLVNLPEQDVVATGIEAIQEMYASRFATPGLRCEVHHRSEIGNIAIDRETMHTANNPPIDILAMYDVTDGKIARIFFIRSGILPTS